MPSLTERIRRFLNSPQGRQARARVEGVARDPRNRERARGLLARLRSRRR
ncbi:hypothetical protein BTM25_24590 [Actinomadura rubteroloni]|uniref:Uncharacterized protein n=1 Tax=Actinomadura rubteroloni TaxID=1926885 RepID=A0A2P4UFK0_9ACTN|nr:hypothetical protein [Actinomadura rubteroloni]POM23833.1 hypothetical protein BTM25_24590 [Actinomadura rubteroloni]